MKETVACNRIPLLWLLLPLTFGIASSEYVFQIPTSLAIASAFLFGTSSIVLYSKHERAWSLSISLMLFTVGNVYMSSENLENSPRIDFPKREAILEVSIQRIFNQNDERVSGIATITDTDPHLAPLKKRSLYFSLIQSPNDARISIGSRHQVRGLLESLESAAGSSSFDTYLKATGQWGKLTNGDFLQETAAPNIIYRWAEHRRLWIVQSLAHSLDPNAGYSHTYQAIMLGKKNELSTEQRDIFLKSGTMHLFAISGLHIGIIATCFVSLFRLVRMRENFIPLATLIGIATFVVISGGGASAWRALLMISCYFLCQGLKLQKAPVNALVLSAIICLLIDPRQLFQAGFQMSYSVVFVILLFGVPLAQKTKEWWKPFAFIPRPLWGVRLRVSYSISRYIIDIVSISVAASTVSGLLSIHYFETLPILGVLLSAFILPLASLAIIAGFCSLISSLLFLAPLASVFNHAAAALLLFIETIIEWISKVPHGSIQSRPEHSPHLIIVATILAIALCGYSKSWKIALPLLWSSPFALLGILYLWMLV